MKLRLIIVLVLSLPSAYASPRECLSPLAKLSSALQEVDREAPTEAEVKEVYSDLLGNLDLKALKSLDKTFGQKKALKNVMAGGLKATQITKAFVDVFEIVEKRIPDEAHRKMIKSSIKELIAQKTPQADTRRKVRKKRSVIKTPVVKIFKDPEDYDVSAMEISPDGKWLVVATALDHVFSISLTNKKAKPQQLEWPVSSKNKSSASFNFGFYPKKPLLLVNAFSDLVKYKFVSGKWKKQKSVVYSAFVWDSQSIRISPDEKEISVLTHNKVTSFQAGEVNRQVEGYRRDGKEGHHELYTPKDHAFTDQGYRVLAVAEGKENPNYRFLYILNGNPGFPYPLESYEVLGLPSQEIEFLRFSPDATKIFAGGKKGDFYVIERTKPNGIFEEIRVKATKIFQNELKTPLSDLSFSQDGSLIAIVDQTGTFTVVDGKKMKEVFSRKIPRRMQRSKGNTLKIRMAPDGTKAAVSFEDEILLFDLTSLKEEATE